MIVDIAVENLNKPYTLLLYLTKICELFKGYVDKVYLRDAASNQLTHNVMTNIKKTNKDVNFIYIYGEADGDTEQRCRYGDCLDNTDKEYALVTHSDTIFHKNPIIRFEELIKQYSTSDKKVFQIGVFGQCWKCDNRIICPQSLQSRINNKNFVTEKVENIDKFICYNCRINEWCCLIHIPTYRKCQHTGADFGYKFLHVYPSNHPYYTSHSQIGFDYNAYLTNYAYFNREIFINDMTLENFSWDKENDLSRKDSLLNPGEAYYTHIVSNPSRIAWKEEIIENFIKDYIIKVYGESYLNNMTKN